MRFPRAPFALATLLALTCAVARGDVATVSVADGSIVQPGHRSTGYIDFPVTRSGDTSYRVAVGYETENGTAGSGSNYRKTSSVTVIEAGESATTARVQVFSGNTETELTFYVNLRYAAGFGPPAEFAPQQSFATGDYPAVVEVGDVNGDGKPDLVVANRGADTISVLLNTMSAGAATPSFAAQQLVSTADYPVALALADLNGDGRIDLIVGYGDPNNAKQVSVFLNATVPGSGTVAFGSAQAFAVGDTPGAIVAADLNTDGKPDVVAANYYDGTLSVLLNTTAPAAPIAAFATQTVAITGFIQRVLATDINTDGRDDLVVGGKVYLNTTASGASTASFAAGQDGGGAGAADLNQDGIDDLYGGGILVNTTVAGSATTSFVPISFLYGLGDTRDAGDFNGDGCFDLVRATSSGLEILISRSPAGLDVVEFAPAAAISLGAAPEDATAADLNADGKPDLVAPIATTDSIVVLLNTVPDAAFNPAQYDAVLDVAQVTGTIFPRTFPVGGHGGSSLDAWAVLALLALAALRLRRRTTR